MISSFLQFLYLYILLSKLFIYFLLSIFPSYFLHFLYHFLHSTIPLSFYTSSRVPYLFAFLAIPTILSTLYSFTSYSRVLKAISLPYYPYYFLRHHHDFFHSPLFHLYYISFIFSSVCFYYVHQFAFLIHIFRLLPSTPTIATASISSIPYYSIFTSLPPLPRTSAFIVLLIDILPLSSPSVSYCPLHPYSSVVFLLFPSSIFFSCFPIVHFIHIL